VIDVEVQPMVIHQCPISSNRTRRRESREGCLDIPTCNAMSNVRTLVLVARSKRGKRIEIRGGRLLGRSLAQIDVTCTAKLFPRITWRVKRALEEGRSLESRMLRMGGVDLISNCDECEKDYPGFHPEACREPSSQHEHPDEELSGARALLGHAVVRRSAASAHCSARVSRWGVVHAPYNRSDERVLLLEAQPVKRSR